MYYIATGDSSWNTKLSKKAALMKNAASFMV
jgi:hypothetical protein